MSSEIHGLKTGAHADDGNSVQRAVPRTLHDIGPDALWSSRSTATIPQPSLTCHKTLVPMAQCPSLMMLCTVSLLTPYSSARWLAARKDAIFARYRMLSEMLGVLLVREAQKQRSALGWPHLVI